MRRTTLGVGVSALAVLAAITSPAIAASRSVRDSHSDAIGGPEVVRVVVKNKAHAINARVDLDGDVPGRVIVSIDRRTGRGRTFDAVRKASGKENAFLFNGSFADDRFGGQVPCNGYSATWDQSAGHVRFHMPARCMGNGSYHKVRFAAFSETPDGSDSDYAPDTSGPIVWTRWITRG